MAVVCLPWPYTYYGMGGNFAMFPAQTMLECFTHAIEQLALLPGWKAPPHAMSQFWGAHQRFFKQMCMAIKVSAVVSLSLIHI